MMRNLEKLGFVPPDPRAATTLTKVEAQPGTDLTVVTQAAGMEWTEFSAHNPAYKRHVSPVDRGSVLYVPGHARDKALASLNDARARRADGWKTYTVKKNDSWQRISANSGVPVGVLQRVNDHKTLKAGVMLRIPGGGTSPAATQIAQVTPAAVKRKAAASQAAALRAAWPAKGAHATQAALTPAPKTEAKASAKEESVYLAKAGDTVYSIARTHGTDVDSVLRANHLTSPLQLRAGQTLRIPGASGGAPLVAAAKPQGPPAPEDKSGNKKAAKPADNAGNASAARGAGNAGTYLVQPGDTMWSIARKHNVPPHDLMRINNLSDPAMLRPGDTIRVALK
jgi:membrane-bound lytic murein transglycosylase D